MIVEMLQLAPVAGAIDANADMIAAAISAAQPGSLVVTGELDLCGYPVLDLALDPEFVAHSTATVKHLATRIDPTVTAIVGCVFDATDPLVIERVDTTATLDASSRIAVNAAAVLHAGDVVAVFPKRLLPTYATFDEARTFLPGRLAADSNDLIQVTGADGTITNVAVLICEDLWHPEPAAACAGAGADVLAVLNASPFHTGKQQLRRDLAVTIAENTAMTVVYVNRAGATDELCFDGGSLIATSAGVAVELARFATDARRVDLGCLAVAELDSIDANDELWSAIVTTTRAYLTDNGFSHVVVGASGGIDSAVVAAVAADALGPKALTTVAMPGPYSSAHSVTDAADLAARIGCRHHVVDITGVFDAFGAALGVGAEETDPRPLAGTEFDTTEENLQARSRGAILMALANKGVVVDGHKCQTLTLTTSNRTESAVGYATLYGDLAGGFAPIRDVAKTDVFALAEWRNNHIPAVAHPSAVLSPIPPDSISKPPSAELAPDQFDSDALPPYPLLDRILELLVLERRSPSITTAMVAAGDFGCSFDEAATIVARIARLVRMSEHKRRQSPPGPRVTPLSFGTDRHVTITNHWSPGVSRPVPAT